MTSHDEQMAAVRQRRFLDEAQHAADPELAEVEKLLERIASYAPKFAAPLEPSGHELAELDAKLVEAWRTGKDGRKILDDYRHPWLDSPERRQGFVAARFVRAQSGLRSELDAAKRPSDGQIQFLDATLQEATTELLKRPDANARQLFAATHAALFSAWHGVFTKLVGYHGPLQVTPAHVIANSDEVRITSDITGVPHHRIGEALAVLVIDHGARPWLPTPGQYAAEVERLTEEEEPTPPKTSGRVRSVKA